MSINVKHAGQQ